MTHIEIRQKFLEFFEKRGHKIAPSSSLLPSDQSVLFTTAGMQQFKPYYTGKADPADFKLPNGKIAKGTTSTQKCLRTSDIDEVGDESHLTFFEMLGNFSFGGYGKKEAIEWTHEFITKEMELKIDFVSVFKGEEGIPADEDSEKIWREIAPDVEIKKFGKEDNFWGPTGEEGPCGPTTEIYVNGIEIWNLVFNEYYCLPVRRADLPAEQADRPGGELKKIKTLGIDTGMGLERLAMMVQGKNNIFETDLFEPILKLVPTELDKRTKRIIADHSRAIAFLISDGARPSNKEQGYVLRRLIRRVVTHLEAQLTNGQMRNIFAKIVEIYGQYYSNLDTDTIINAFDSEKEKFEKTLRQGLKELQKLNKIDAQSAFKLYESYGLPYEIIKDMAGEKTKHLNRKDFDEEFKKHQEFSRTASVGIFKGGLADASIETTKLHTTSHLMLEAMRRILGIQVQQKGSNINSERLRFDFSYSQKMTPEQIKQVEDMVNKQIQKDLPVRFEEMSVDKAKEIGATGVFEHKYGDEVKVYFIGKEGNYFSKEICGGPHVSRTGEIGKFLIKKEEAVGAGIRRIRAEVKYGYIH